MDKETGGYRGGSGGRGNFGEHQHQKSNRPENQQNYRHKRRGQYWADNRRGRGLPDRFRGSNNLASGTDGRHYERHRDQGPGYANSFQKFRDPPNSFRPDASMGAANEKPTAENLQSSSKIEPLMAPEVNNTLKSQNPVPTDEKKPESSSSSSSDSEASVDSAVRSLKQEVNKTLLANSTSKEETKTSEILEKVEQKVEVKESKKQRRRRRQNERKMHTENAANMPEISKESMQLNLKPAEMKQPVVKTETPKEKPAKELLINVKKEQSSKSDSSSSSSSSSSSTSSSSEDSSEESSQENGKKPSSVEDVICLGNLEKFENLVEEEEVPGKSVCMLCDKPGHISFHCQMICKNCNGKYHGLKDCPKPASLAIVFSNFLQFCLKQSWKYNPNAEFTIDEATSNANMKFDRSKNEQVKRKSRSGTPRSSRKRQKSTSSDSSGSNSDSTPTRKKKRRSKKSDGLQTALQIPFTVPFQPAFNSFGMTPSGAVNPLLAFSHMMGYNPGASIDFRGNMAGKDQHYKRD